MAWQVGFFFQIIRKRDKNYINLFNDQLLYIYVVINKGKSLNTNKHFEVKVIRGMFFFCLSKVLDDHLAHKHN